MGDYTELAKGLLKIANLFSDHEITMEECHKNFMKTEYHGPYAITYQLEDR